MNTTACSSSSISVNVSRRASARPSPEPARREGKTSTNGHPSREATALANVVLPVPGGPNSTIARGGMTPYSSARSGSTSGSTTRRSMSSFSCSMPASASHRPRGEHPAAERLRAARPPGAGAARPARSTSGRGSRSRVSRNARVPVWPSTSSADSRCTPRAHQACLELGEHRAAEPVPRQSSASASRTIQPRSPNDPRHGRADDDLADGRDDRDAAVAQRAEHLGQPVDRRPLRAPRLLPDADDLVEVVVVELADPRGRHARESATRTPTGRGGGDRRRSGYAASRAGHEVLTDP